MIRCDRANDSNEIESDENLLPNQGQKSTFYVLATGPYPFKSWNILNLAWNEAKNNLLGIFWQTVH